jgi:hypothetical protein
MLMKLLLSGIFASSAIIAQPVFILSLQDSSFFTAEINNQVFNEPQSVMNFYDVPSGNHSLKVFKILKTANSIIKQPVFEGTVLIDQNSSLVGYIDKYNQLKISSNTARLDKKETATYNQTRYPNPNNIPTNTQNQTNKDGMSNTQFNSVLENLNAISLENERFNTAKGIISISSIKSSQIAEMMLKFENENNRVQLADYALKYVVDPQNYGVVYNAIRSPRSIRRLNRKLSN